MTAVVIVLGIPHRHISSSASRQVAATIMLACVAIPFWTSLLVRTYAWMVLLLSAKA